MRLTARALLPLIPLLAACRVEVGADTGTNGNDGTDGSETGNTNSTSATDTDPTDTTDTGTTDTGGEEFCGLSPDGPDTPWFTLSEHGVPLEDGGILYIECGGQGAFMLEIEPEVGGVTPEGDYLPFHVELDVEGFNLGANGHFASSDVDLFVACCDYDYEYGCYYETYTLRLFPPDQIADLAVLHELPGSLRVTLTGPGEPVEQVVNVQLWAVDDGSWEWCNGYGYGLGHEQPLAYDGAIPQ